MDFEPGLFVVLGQVLKEQGCLGREPPKESGPTRYGRVLHERTTSTQYVGGFRLYRTCGSFPGVPVSTPWHEMPPQLKSESDVTERVGHVKSSNLPLTHLIDRLAVGCLDLSFLRRLMIWAEVVLPGAATKTSSSSCL